MRELFIATGLLISTYSVGQIQIDRSINLQGTRSVSELEDPAADNQAVNARTILGNDYLYATSTGTNTISCNLSTSVSSLETGMSLYLEISNTNTGSVTLSVNSLAPVPVLKNAVMPLDGGDLLAGMAIQLVFDGTAFQVLTAPERPRRPCPSGMVEINSQFCIEPDERPALDFPDAANNCGQIGGKLCSWAEFTAACHRDTLFGLNDMVGNYEWTNTAANADDLVRIAGWNNCRSAGTNFTISATPRPYRCCFRR